MVVLREGRVEVVMVVLMREGKVMAVAEDRKEAVLGTGVVGVGWVV